MDEPTAISEGAARREARLATPRMTRELATIAAMVRMDCAQRHPDAARSALAGSLDAGLCPECAELLAYARKRLAGCPFGPAKPTCAHCVVHCYGPRQREAVRQVMRRNGPRMPWAHPWLAIAHLLDRRRPAPPKPRARPPAS